MMRALDPQLRFQGLELRSACQADPNSVLALFVEHQAVHLDDDIPVGIEIPVGIDHPQIRGRATAAADGMGRARDDGSQHDDGHDDGDRAGEKGLALHRNTPFGCGQGVPGPRG